MSAIKSNENRKRKRENEVKKWTEEEIKKVLNYMQVHRKIEKPTARLYYKKLMEETKINANWNILKCKVRHLKGTLQKADAWINSIGAGVQEGDGTTSVIDKVHKICPHYEQLSDIFSNKKEIEFAIKDTSSDGFKYSPLDAPDIEDDSFQQSDEPTTSSADVPFAHNGKRRAQITCFEKMATTEASIKKEIELVIMDTPSDGFKYCPLDAPDIEDNSFQLSDEPTTSSADVPFAYNVKRRAQSTCFEKMATMEAQRTNFREKQLKLETEKFEWAKEVDKQKLEIEKQKIDNDFEVKKLELQQNERLKMFEIEMKYKNNK